MNIAKHSVLFLILNISVILECSAGPNEKRLLHHLLDKYNVHERPVATESDTLVVSVSVKLASIVYVNLQAQQIGANFLIRYDWQDVNLQWNASEFGEIKRTIISPHRIWKPSIRMSKEANGDSGSVCWDSNVVRLNGSVTQEHSMKLELICSISAIDFPYEEHECELGFFSSAYTPDEVVFTTYGGQEEGDISQFIAAPEFQLLGFPVKVVNDENKSQVSYSIRIRRQGDVHLKFAIIYSIIASSMVILSSLASPKSPFKLLISLTGMATSVYSIYAIESRACTYSQNNTPIRIVEFFTHLLLVSLLSFISNSVVIYVYNLETKMPSFLSDKMRHLLRSSCCFKLIANSSSKNAFDDKARMNEQPNDQIEIADKAKDSVDKNINLRQQQAQCDWQLFALMVDRVLFITWTSVVTVLLIICFPKQEGFLHANYEYIRTVNTLLQQD